jgi:hypothetical protein
MVTEEPRTMGPSPCEDSLDDPLDAKSELSPVPICGLLVLFGCALSVLGEVLKGHNPDSATTIGLAACCVVSLAIPTTIAIGTHRSSFPRRWTSQTGGVSFLVLQLIATLLWMVTVTIGLCVIISGVQQLWTGLLSVMGVSGLAAQVLVSVSLHILDSSTKGEPSSVHPPTDTAEIPEMNTTIASGRTQRAEGIQQRAENRELQAESRKATDKDTTHASGQLGWRGVGNLGFGLSLFSLLLAIVLENVEFSRAHSLSVGSVALSAVLVSVPLTHGLGGHFKDEAFAFYQPLRGGTTFVLMQAMGWSLWGVSVLLSLLALFLEGAQRGSVAGVVTSAGVGGVISQLLVLWSIRYFDHKLTLQICGSSTPRTPLPLSSQFPRVRSATATTTGEVTTLTVSRRSSLLQGLRDLGDLAIVLGLNCSFFFLRFL